MIFLTWLIQFPVIILVSFVWFHCCNSVSYDFHCLILCKQMSYIIIIMILTAIIHFYSQKIVGGSSWNSTFSFRSGLVDVHVYLICKKLSLRRILIVLLRPLPTHSLFENGRFNKDGLKNKREYVNKPKRNACKDYLFHK